MTNLVGVEPRPDLVRCDMAVEIVFDNVTDDVTLPKFRPAAQQAYSPYQRYSAAAAWSGV